jgi:hypothetical protein
VVLPLLRAVGDAWGSLQASSINEMPKGSLGCPCDLSPNDRVGRETGSTVRVWGRAGLPDSTGQGGVRKRTERRLSRPYSLES